DGRQRDPRGAAGDRGRSRWANPVSRFRPGKFRDRRSVKCEWRLGIVRMRLVKAWVGLAFALVLLAPGVTAQNPDVWDPEKSTVKAKQLVQQSIEALGGAAFRDYQGMECEGRLAEFDHNGDAAGDANYHNYWQFPDKNRTEYVVHTTKGGLLAVFVGILPVKGGVFILVFSGNEGWTMDKSGVNEAPASTVSSFQAAAKNNYRNVLLLK